MPNQEKKTTTATADAPKETAPASKKRAAAKRTGAKARATAVKKILLNVEKKMKGEELRATLGDYIKLLQLQKELTQEKPTEIKVTWVDPRSEK